MTISPGEIRIWKIPLETSAAANEKILDSRERQRANAFRGERDRRRYVVAHVALRLLAARLSHVAPDLIRFQFNAFGKPELTNGNDLHCNMSHAAGLVLIGFTRSDPLGIDVEKVDEQFDQAKEISPRFLVAAKADEFYQSWVRREACGKVSGLGISQSVDESEYRIFAFAPAPGYVACAAVPRLSTVAALHVADFKETEWNE